MRNLKSVSDVPVQVSINLQKNEYHPFMTARGASFTSTSTRSV
jgi:hypothetical protein